MLLSCGEELGALALICYLSAGEAEVGACCNQPGLPSKLQASSGYSVRPWFKNQNRASQMAQHLNILASQA